MMGSERTMAVRTRTARKRLKNAGAESACCKVESLVSVDERGQMVLPKDVRERAGIRAGDKLALVTWEGSGRVHCIALMKVEELTEMAKGVLAPIMHETLGTGGK
jgi:AbrB family looped-hinge helix DNA binding protein